MEFVCQKDTLNRLKLLAENNKHSILLDGPSGCGKTYLARQYTAMLNIPDFQIIPAKVADIKSAIDTSIQNGTEVVLCIENLDLGVDGASYALLKTLEEPLPFMYIIVTCRSLSGVPDTIISRSVVLSINNPTEQDINMYSEHIDKTKFDQLKKSTLWKCIRTFSDAKLVMDMDSNQLQYFADLKSVISFKDAVNNITWKLEHYEDKSETPIELVIRYIMELCHKTHITRSGIECINDLSKGRLGKHAVISKFVMECVYCE